MATQNLRPTRITHTLTAGTRTDKWTVDVEFAADAAAAAPINVPPPPGPSAVAGTITDWQPIVFTNGWSAWDANTWRNQYRKVGNQVFVRGLGNSGANPAQAAFTLPVGYRPTTTYEFAVVQQETSARRAEVTTAGAFTLQGAPIANMYTTLAFSFFVD